MSAVDYFRDVADVSWRLDRTYLYIGRQLWYVETTKGAPNFPAKHAILDMYCAASGNHRHVPLSDLPEQALFDAPRGYFKHNSGVYWGARGPVRDRHQGLKMYSLWYLNIDAIVPQQGLFELSSDYVRAMAGCTNRLLRKSWGQVSREVLLYQGRAYFQGRPVGKNPEERVVEITETEPTEFLVGALRKAGCDVK